MHVREQAWRIRCPYGIPNTRVRFGTTHFN